MLTLKNIEMLRAGPTNDGRYVSAKKIAKIFRDTLIAMADGMKPKAKVGDSHESAEISGIISKIRHAGDALMGDIDVADDVFEKLMNGAIPDDRSVEIAYGFTLSNGTTLKHVLTGIVFGVALPAEHSLASVFESAAQASYFNHFAHIAADSSPTVELAMAEYSRLKSAAGEVIAQSGGADDVKERIERFEREAKDVFLNSILQSDVAFPGLRRNLDTIYEGVKKMSGHDNALRCIRELFTSGSLLHISPQVPLISAAHTPGSFTLNGGLDPTSH
jgi:hypothetical protein